MKYEVLEDTFDYRCFYYKKGEIVDYPDDHSPPSNVYRLLEPLPKVSEEPLQVVEESLQEAKPKAKTKKGRRPYWGT